MKGYKNVGLPKRPSLMIRDKTRKTWENKKSQFPIVKKDIISWKGLRNDKNGTYD